LCGFEELKIVLEVERAHVPMRGNWQCPIAGDANDPQSLHRQKHKRVYRRLVYLRFWYHALFTIVYGAL